MLEMQILKKLTSLTGEQYLIVQRGCMYCLLQLIKRCLSPQKEITKAEKIKDRKFLYHLLKDMEHLKVSVDWSELNIYKRDSLAGLHFAKRKRVNRSQELQTFFFRH